MLPRKKNKKKTDKAAARTSEVIVTIINVNKLIEAKVIEVNVETGRVDAIAELFTRKDRNFLNNWCRKISIYITYKMQETGAGGICTKLDVYELTDHPESSKLLMQWKDGKLMYSPESLNN